MTDSLKTLSGDPVGRFAFGTMQFGGKADAGASREMYDTCRAAGIRHFDTAVGYTDGMSEKILGPMIAAERDQIFVASKLAYVGGAGRENLQKQMDLSRSQLGLDQIDLMYLHRFDDKTELEETFSTLAEFQTQGMIRHIGVSNYAAWQVVKANTVAKSFGTRIDAIQPMYNLVKRQAEVEIMPMAMDQGIDVIPYSPLGGGLLTGKYLSGGTGRLSTNERYAARYGLDWMPKTAAALADLGNELGQDPATLAVAWAAAHPSKPIPILSASSVDQLKPSLLGMSFRMSSELYASISALSPTPPPATDRIEEA